MQIHHLTPQNKQFPAGLRFIPQPPTELFVRGNVDLLNMPALAVVGSRAISPYGKRVTDQLVTEVAWAGITIVSGLALGVDALAHSATLATHSSTIAVLPCGIENIYPACHYQLARRIIEQGGAVVSEYGGTMRPQKFHFIARNRIIAGLSQAVLITEASVRSGSLHTAQFALEEGKEVMAVPGSIFSPTSVGTHNLIDTGARIVKDAEDIINFFNDSSHKLSRRGANGQEQTILDLMRKGVTDTGILIEASQLTIQVFNQTLTMLEITGFIKNQGNSKWSLN